MESKLEETLDELFSESSSGEELPMGRFKPFLISDYHTLNRQVVRDFEQGKKCVWSKIENPNIPACAQIAFKGQNTAVCYVLYVGFFYSTMGIFANITEWHRKVMQEYGKFYDGQWVLNVDRSAKKAPIFTQLFQERQQVGKPYLMPQDGQVFLTQQIRESNIETDRDFYNAVGGILKIAQGVLGEIQKGNIGSYSFVKDLMGALRIYLRLS